jgi:membrane fusion protein (multidrug efflux system)
MRVFPTLLLPLLLVAAVAHASAGETGPGGKAPETGTLSIEKCQIKVVDRSLLAAERDGIVAETPVREGDIVAADQLLLTLRDDAARTQLELARARAANDVEVRFSRKVADAAGANYEAGLQLEKQSAINAFQLRQRKLEYERGQLSVEQATFQLDLAGLEIARAEADLRGYHVSAPFAGTVLRVLKRRGESVRNGDPVIELVNTDRVHVEAYCNLADLWHTRAGAHVDVQLDAPELARFGVTEESFEGKLILVDPVVQPVTGMVRIVAEIQNRNNILRDGLKARMTIDRAASGTVPVTTTP